MKKVITVLKNVIFAPFIIYIYNLIATPVNFVIPINIFTVIVVGILGIPGLVGLVLIFYLLM